MGIYKTGIVSESSFSETLMCQYDTNFYDEPDGSVWIRISHHNNPTTYKFASTDTFASSVYKDDNRWFNVSLCNVITGTWEVMVKQKTTSTATETKFRWTQKTNPMLGTYEDVAPSSANIVRNTSSGYTVSSFGGLYKLNSNTYLVATNGSKGNWWGAIGAWGAHQGGIPGYNAQVVTTGYIDLYLRVDNISNSKTSKYKVGFCSNEFFEI